MQILYTALALLVLNFNIAHGATCSRTLTFVDGAILTAAQLNAEFNAITNCSNSLNDANIASLASIDPSKISSTIAGDGLSRNGTTGVLSVGVDGSTVEITSDTLNVKDSGITTAKLATNAVTTAKITDSNVTTAKVNDAAITLAKLASAVANALVPVGTIIMSASDDTPTGYLPCEGGLYDRTEYADLFASIGTSWGTTASDNFAIPDLRGRFVRGSDRGAGRDPDAATRTAHSTGGATGDNVGTLQDEQYKSHTHTISGTFDSGGTVNVYANNSGGSIGSVITGTFGGAGLLSITGTATASGGNETRPKNVNVRYYIKY